MVTAGIDFDIVGDPRLPESHFVLYVASGNPMNVRGLRDFLQFAWPSIRQHVPDAELHVAGAVSEFIENELPGVLALGPVQDLAEVYGPFARVVINPALAGTGVKIKTVEALSHLRPIVTWPTGVDGLPRDLRGVCDVVQDWSEFGRQVVRRLIESRTEAFFASGTPVHRTGNDSPHRVRRTVRRSSGTVADSHESGSVVPAGKT